MEWLSFDEGNYLRCWIVWLTIQIAFTNVGLVLVIVHKEGKTAHVLEDCRLLSVFPCSFMFGPKGAQPLKQISTLTKPSPYLGPKEGPHRTLLCCFPIVVSTKDPRWANDRRNQSHRCPPAITLISTSRPLHGLSLQPKNVMSSSASEYKWEWMGVNVNKVLWDVIYYRVIQYK